MGNRAFILLLCVLLFGIVSFGKISNAHAQLEVFTDTEFPSNYLQNGCLVGTSVEVVHELLKRAELDSEIRFVPWPRAYEYAKRTKNVLLFTAGKNQERLDQGFHFIGPVISRVHALYKRQQDHFAVSSFDDIRKQHLTVGGVFEDWRSNYLKQQGIIMDLSTGYDLNIRKIKAGRFELLVSSDIEVPMLLQREHLPKDYLEFAVAIKDAPSYIMLSKGTDEHIIKRLEDEFKKLTKTNFFYTVANKYSKLIGYQLYYSPQKGFHRLTRSQAYSKQ